LSIYDMKFKPGHNSTKRKPDVEIDDLFGGHLPRNEPRRESVSQENEDKLTSKRSKPEYDLVISPERGPTDEEICITLKNGAFSNGEYLIHFLAKEECILHRVFARASNQTLNLTQDFDHPKAHSIVFDVYVQGMNHSPLKFTWINQATVVAETKLTEIGFYPFESLEKVKEVPKDEDMTYIIHLMAALGYAEGLLYLRDKLGIDISKCWASTGQNYFHVGVACNFIEVVRLGLDSKLDMHLQNKWGLSPLMLAKKKPENNPIRKLLESIDL
jgi:hypothetical protein